MVLLKSQSQSILEAYPLISHFYRICWGKAWGQMWTYVLHTVLGHGMYTHTPVSSLAAGT